MPVSGLVDVEGAARSQCPLWVSSRHLNSDGLGPLCANSRPYMHEGAGMKQAPDALMKIAEARASFASRADDSGTHKAELTVRMDGL